MAVKAPRQAAETRGRRAESLAVLWFAARGFRPVARRWRAPGTGEVDLIVQRGGLLVFVEIKWRQDMTSARMAVTATQQARIARAAAAYLAHHPGAAGRGSHDGAIRFDVLALAPWRWPCHIRDAWRGDDRGSNRPLN